MVSLLEPFIDTIVICTITGLVILSSGAWSEKYENRFQGADLMYLQGVVSDQDEAGRELLYQYLALNNDEAIGAYSGTLSIEAGQAQNVQDFTVMHARSIAEDVRYTIEGEPFTGELSVQEGVLDSEGVELIGKSLIHSAALTSIAFNQGLFGDAGQYIVSIALILFAFSTAIAWSYYGDRAITYLFGPKLVMPYRVVYCLAFFVASFTDTTIVWNFAAVSVVVMTLPNLFGIVLLRKEMRQLLTGYTKE